MLRNHLSRIYLSYGLNHFTIDAPFRWLLEAFGLPESYVPRLEKLGEFVGREFLELVDYIDKSSPPLLQMWDVKGERLDWVHLNPAHRELLEALLRQGIISATFREQAPWQFHYAAGYLIADAGIYCTLTVTNQTVYALEKYGSPELRQKYLPRFLPEDDREAWFGATFYTETHAGSDLGATTAEAVRENGEWRIYSRDKYFASNAGIADAALITARPRGAPSGPKGLALFFVPAYLENGQPNYIIRRLKDKLGTRAVPTGEVELEGALAYPLGKTDQGIYIALEVLTLARIANSVAAMGLSRKAYLEALQYTEHRMTFGKPLIAHPLIKKDLLEMEVLLEANLALALKTVALFNRCARLTPPYNADYHYARFLGHITKNMTAEASALITRKAMELFGGIGFLEEFPIARWHREALVTPIWEGSSNIQALDMLEVMLKKQVHRQFFEEARQILKSLSDFPGTPALRQQLQRVEKQTEAILNGSLTLAQFRAKDLLTQLGHLANPLALLEAARAVSDQEAQERFREIAALYITQYLEHKSLPDGILQTIDEIIHFCR
ncbi:MAG: DNA alkylation response protein [Calditrichaeota bacterium]|nr:DNA alkylation response protein [Calditrichota bacterium]